MKRFHILIFFILLFLFCKAEPQNLQDIRKKEEILFLEKLYKETSDHSQAYSTLKEISQMGNRMTATENGRLAEEFVFQKLKEYGYEPRYHNFPINIWTRDNASLRIRRSNSVEDVNTLAFAYTPKLSHVSGRIVDVGNGLESDFKKHEKEIKGNIVLVNLHVMDIKDYKGGNPHRSTRLQNSFAKGAIGVIMVNKYEGEILATGTVAHTDKLVSIPAVCISYRDGKKIRESIRQGEMVEANIQLQNEQTPSEARNVIATLPGTDKEKERVILGGHLDTWDVSAGAMDNGIGAFAILDIARAMKKIELKPARSIEFVFWMGEEQGLVGSRQFIKDELEAGTLDSISYYVNIDLDGNPMGLNVQGWSSLLEKVRSIGKKIQSHHKEYKNIMVNRFTDSSDNVPFAVAGIPVLRMLRNIPEDKMKYYHSNKDSFHLIEEPHIKNSAIVMGLATYLIANDRVTNYKRMDVKETEDFFRSFKRPYILSDSNHWKLRKDLESKSK